MTTTPAPTAPARKGHIAVVLPDDTIAYRRTDNAYTHVVAACRLVDGVAEWNAGSYHTSYDLAVKASGGRQYSRAHRTVVVPVAAQVEAAKVAKVAKAKVGAPVRLPALDAMVLGSRKAPKATKAPAVKVAPLTTAKAVRVQSSNRKVDPALFVAGSRWQHVDTIKNVTHKAVIAADGTWTVTTAAGVTTKGVKSSTAAATLASDGGKWSGVVYWKPAAKATKKA